MHREALKSIANEKIVPPIIVAKNIDIVDLPQKERNFADLCSKTCICRKKAVILRTKSQKTQNYGTGNIKRAAAICHSDIVS